MLARRQPRGRCFPQCILAPPHPVGFTHGPSASLLPRTHWRVAPAPLQVLVRPHSHPSPTHQQHPLHHNEPITHCPAISAAFMHQRLPLTTHRGPGNTEPGNKHPRLRDPQFLHWRTTNEAGMQKSQLLLAPIEVGGLSQAGGGWGQSAGVVPRASPAAKGLPLPDALLQQ